MWHQMASDLLYGELMMMMTEIVFFGACLLSLEVCGPNGSAVTHPTHPKGAGFDSRVVLGFFLM
jgi:hypothetical protein